MKVKSFLPIAPRRIPKATKPTAGIHHVQMLDPCNGCPLQPQKVKLLPILPEKPLLIMVGACPSEEETKAKRLLVGKPGMVILETLEESGLTMGEDVGLINLTRCQMEDDETDSRVSSKGQFIKDMFESPKWWSATSRCKNYLLKDLMPYRNVPLIPLGTQPLQRLMGNIKVFTTKNRGLRRRTRDGTTLFPTWNPAALFNRYRHIEEQRRMTEEFKTDIRNAAAIVRGTGKPRPITIHLYTKAYDIIAFLEWLYPHPGPWAFDIETFDDRVFPSREDVSTDPCHPDFRVRGVGISWDGEEGAFLELKGFRPGDNHLTKTLAKVFENDAPKWAANGHFDEEGLVYPGWTPTVTNRAGDSMLAMIAASGGILAGFSLERGVVDVLQEFYHWSDVDKRNMRDLDVETVADGCVRDAAATWRLCDKIHGVMERGEYLP